MIWYFIMGFLIGGMTLPFVIFLSAKKEEVLFNKDLPFAELYTPKHVKVDLARYKDKLGMSDVDLGRIVKTFFDWSSMSNLDDREMEALAEILKNKCAKEDPVPEDLCKFKKE